MTDSLTNLKWIDFYSFFTDKTRWKQKISMNYALE